MFYSRSLVVRQCSLQIPLSCQEVMGYFNSSERRNDSACHSPTRTVAGVYKLQVGWLLSDFEIKMRFPIGSLLPSVSCVSLP